jgi:hypothetical protein
MKRNFLEGKMLVPRNTEPQMDVEVVGSDWELIKICFTKL